MAFEEAIAELRAEGITVVAASVDPHDKAEETARALELSFPVGYGLDLKPTAASLGAFYEERRQILHATGMVVRPDATLAVTCYSSGPIGRLQPENVLRAVRFWKDKG